MRGGSLPALQQIRGHATLAMTMRYSHPSPRVTCADEMEKTDAACQQLAAEIDRSRGRKLAQEIEGAAVLPL